MSNIKNQIVLSCSERKELTKFASTGNHPAKLIRRAEIILALDTSEDRKPLPEQQIADTVGVSRQTVQNAKTAFFSMALSDFLKRKKRETPPVPAKVDGDLEAHIIALACSEAPEGYARWTLRMLADKSVELGYVDAISHSTVGRVLKKTNSGRI